MSLRKSYRAADDLDLTALTSERGSAGRNLLTVSLPFGVAVFMVIYFRWRAVLIAGGIAAALFAASAFSNIRFFRKVKRRQNLKKDGKAVEVWEISAERILDIHYLGSNGPAFCFFVGEGKALLLVGQWLMKWDPFPSEAFRLHRWSDDTEPIRIEVTGKPRTPEPSSVQLKPGYRFGKVELFEATPATLQSDLDRALGAKVVDS
jgi:hypothetical protein